MRNKSGTIKAIVSERANLSVIKGKLRSGEKSRTRLAAWVCRHLGLHDARGRPRVSSCLKALRDLEREGHFKLPAPVLTVVSHWRTRRHAGPVAAPKDVPEQLREVRDLHLVLVSPDEEERMRTWNELMAREHPQGKRRLVGRQLRYLVGSAHGWLGAVGFSASALYLEARDRWIGWDAQERRAQEGRVVNLSRLLIRPGVRCRNLASYVLGACVRRVQKDFQARYGYAPWLLESFVDRDKYRGTCFQAANWERIGQTKGRGRNDRANQSPESIKDIYVYPLAADFRRKMGMTVERGGNLRALAVEEGLSSGEWAKQEFGGVELGDKRLRDRLLRIVEDRCDHPDASYLEAAGGDRYAAKGYYTFIDNPRETLRPEAMLSTHRKRTMERMMSHQLALVVQDTTDLNFSTRPHTEGLGFVGTNQTGAQSWGLQLHSSVVLTPEGLPLGVLRAMMYAPERKGQAGKKSIGRPIEEKKSFRWLEGYRDCVAVAKKMPKTRLLTVMDREGDIFELFEEAEATRKRVGVLVRARHNRRLEGREGKLFETLKASRSRTRIGVVIPRQRWKQAKRDEPEQKGLPDRQAVLTICFQKISVASTRSDLRSAPPIPLWGVYAREEHPPAQAKAIEWFLLTTEEVQTAEEAARIVALYCRRWRIEEWHRVLKSGCKVQEHQHQTAERLKRAIAIDVVLAWRIQLMVLLGREVPELPCDVFFENWEVKVLEALQEQRPHAKEGQHPMQLSAAITLVAQLGGYLARGCDAPPGTKCLWKGMIRLSGMAEGYRLAETRGASP
ncbi:MAG: IS4 family transposase [Candidatus Acidiferrales bacterium]